MNLYDKIKNLLGDNNIEYEETNHKPVFTSHEAAKIRGSKLSEGAKALIFWADSKPIQIVIQGDKRVDRDKFKNRFGFKKLKMVTSEEVKEISSVEPGAVAPFGNLFEPEIPVYCTKSLLQNDKIEFNAGHHGISIRLNPQDWQNIVNPIVGEFEENG